MLQTQTGILTPAAQFRKSHPIVRRIAAMLCATGVVAAAAHISFPLPFTPVPFTLQPLAVLGVALWLGPWEGALALVAYLLEGAAFLPVFAPTGPGGVAQLFGPTGGYLLAYPLVALLAGGIARSTIGRLGAFRAACLACTVATLVLFASGASWLAWQAHLSWSQVWFAAVAPFLPGEAVKVLAAAGGYRALSSQSRLKRVGESA